MKLLRSVVAGVMLAFAPMVAAETQGPSTVRLKTGEQITGEWVNRGELSATIKSPGVGLVTISPSDIVEIIGPDGQSVAYEPVLAEGLFGTSLFAGWERQFDLGLNGAVTPQANPVGVRGSADTISLNTGLTFFTDRAAYRTTLASRYWLTNTDGNISQNAFRALANHDQFIPEPGSRFFVFGRAQYDYDDLQGFRNRASVFFGPGYDLVKKPDYTLTGRAGLGVTQDFGRSSTDEFRVEALIGFDGRWQIAPNQSLVYSSTYFPSLSDFHDGRVVSFIAYQADIDQARGIALRLGIEHKYELRTADVVERGANRTDTDHNDWRYFANVVMKF